MEGLTWRSLLAPEYVQCFLEGFLLAFLPALGLGNVAEGSGMLDLTVFPSTQMILGASGLGLLGGIRSLRNLRAPAPAPRPDKDAEAPKP